MSVNVRSSVDNVWELEAASGKDGVFAKVLYDEGMDPWMPVWIREEGVSIEDAQRRAKQCGSLGGIVVCERWLRVRILNGDALAESVARLVGAEAVATMAGSISECTSVPLSWNGAMLKQALQQAGLDGGEPIRRKVQGKICQWVVRFADGKAPQSTCMLTAEGNLIQVRPVTDRQPQPRKVMRWRPGKGTGASGSWSQRGSGGEGGTWAQRAAASVGATQSSAKSSRMEVDTENGPVSADIGAQPAAAAQVVAVEEGAMVGSTQVLQQLQSNMADMSDFLAKMDATICTQFQTMDGHIRALQKKVFESEPVSDQQGVVTQEVGSSDANAAVAPVTPPLVDPMPLAGTAPSGKGTPFTPY